MQCKLMLLFTNRKLYMGFQLVPKSMILKDREWRMTVILVFYRIQ